MSEHKVTLTWKRGDTPFEYQKYPRDHTWKFDGGHEMKRPPLRLIWAIQSMSIRRKRLWRRSRAATCSRFLPSRAKKKFVLDEYVDDAVGHMEKNAEGRMAITRVTLNQRLKFSGEKQPTRKRSKR